MNSHCVSAGRVAASTEVRARGHEETPDAATIDRFFAWGRGAACCAIDLERERERLDRSRGLR